MKRALLITLMMVGLSISSYAQHKYSCANNANMAFGGYDLVSYFESSSPKIGRSEYKYVYDGLTLFFSNGSNLSKFKKNPEKYMPAYGGWCATAVASDKFVEPNYAMYKIQGDRLLFFEVKAFFNGKTYWDKNPEANKLVADQKYDKRFDD